MKIEGRKVFGFPGQGRATVGVGMGANLLLHEDPQIKEIARRTYEEADDTLGTSLSKIFLRDPEKTLAEQEGLLFQQENSQPATLVTGVAADRVLINFGIIPSVVLGHSVAGAAAGVAAGALQFKDAVLLTKKRGEFMAQAASNGVENGNPGRMYAVLGMTADEVEEICREAGGYLANRNTPFQNIVSADAETMKRVVELIDQKKRENTERKIRYLDLKVTVAAHSPLMADARDNLASYLQTIPITDPELPIISGISGEYMTTAKDIETSLIDGVVNGVDWVRAIEKAEPEVFIHVGPGKVLADFMKEIDEGVTVYTSDELLDTHPSTC
ncbi:MAG: ACP S-malonyltransferase [Candidatus Levybacteria bacterium]|nr:ACP S-malonyltransferase [Candidatus Levybacteria bacterium]